MSTGCHRCLLLAAAVGGGGYQQIHSLKYQAQTLAAEDVCLLLSAPACPAVSLLTYCSRSNVLMSDAACMYCSQTERLSLQRCLFCHFLLFIRLLSHSLGVVKPVRLNRFLTSSHHNSLCALCVVNSCVEPY